LTEIDSAAQYELTLATYSPPPSPSLHQTPSPSHRSQNSHCRPIANRTHIARTPHPTLHPLPLSYKHTNIPNYCYDYMPPMYPLCSYIPYTPHPPRPLRVVIASFVLSQNRFVWDAFPFTGRLPPRRETRAL